MHGLSKVIETSKAKTQVGESSTDVDAWTVSFKHFTCLYEINGIVIVLW